MVKKTLVRTGVLAASLSMIGLAAAPAGAATVVSQSGASALHLSIAGNGVFDTGTIKATHDGTAETVTGEKLPSIGLLGGQDLLNIGVLTQQATAGVSGTNGVSAACSGVAGAGAAVIAIGGSSCIEPGDEIGLTIGNLDLSGVSILNLGGTLNGLGLPVDLLGSLTGVLGTLTSTLTTALAPLSDLGLVGGLGAVEARCEASPGKATGSANIVDGDISLSLPGLDPIVLVDFPVNPAPNTKVLTGLDEVLTAVLKGVNTQLNSAFDGPLAGLTGLTDVLQTTVVDGIVAQLAAQLAPLEENVLDITLNKQTPGANGSINVTAVDLKVLPVLADFGLDSLIDAQIAQVECGPNGTVAGPPADLPEVPTAIAAGDGGSNTQGAVVAGLVALSLAVGVAGQRWYATRR